jgi:TRAP-type mannitol/chloroaromatic compound transport system permease small subunit
MWVSVMIDFLKITVLQFMNKFGNFLGSLILALIVLSFLSVMLSFLFNVVSIPLQDLLVYLHSSCFMLGIVYAFHYDKHVRIDIFYQKFNSTKQNRVNFWGTVLLLIPFFGFLCFISYSYVLSSWLKLEGSGESGGLPFVFGLKTLMLLMPASMLIYVSLKILRKR